MTEAVMPTPCCYTLTRAPLPGQGFPLNVSKGFCHEPDHVTFHREGTGIPGTANTLDNKDEAKKHKNGTLLKHNPNGRSVGEIVNQVVPTSSPALPTSDVTLMTSQKLDSQRCDKLLWPSTNLNITTSKDAFEWMGWSDLDLNVTSMSNRYGGNNDDDDNLSSLSSSKDHDDNDGFVIAMARWFGLREDDDIIEESHEAFTTNKGAKGVQLTIWWIIGLARRFR